MYIIRYYFLQLHGWCGKGLECQNSHDINKIVKTLQPRGAKKRNNSKYSGDSSASLAQIIQRQAEKMKWEEQRQEHRNRVREEEAVHGHKAREKLTLPGGAKRLSDPQDDSSSLSLQMKRLSSERISQGGTSNGEIPQRRTSGENGPQNTAVDGRKFKERITDERGMDEKTDDSRWHNGRTEDIQERIEMREGEGTQGEPNNSHDEDSCVGTNKRKTFSTTTIAENKEEMNKKAKTTEDVDSSINKDKQNLEMTAMENSKSIEEVRNAAREKVKNIKETRDISRSPVIVNDTSNSSNSSSGHRAGFDAFMTGYIFANHVSSSGTLTSSDAPFTPDNLGTTQLVNRVYLMGKNIPFLVRAGTYASMSSNHMAKIPKLRKVTLG